MKELDKEFFTYKKGELRLNNKNGYGGLLLFFADWCGHCQRLKPIWENVERNVNGNGKGLLVAINIEREPEITKWANVNGFPSIFHFDKQGRLREYQGSRSEEDLLKGVQMSLN
jgi:thiol-disulfide isomerase/thioredoxin